MIQSKTFRRAAGALPVLALLACCIWAAAAAPPTTLPANGAGILVQGLRDSIWLAQFIPGDAETGPLTVIRARPVQSVHWKELARIESRVVALASQGQTPIAVLDNGQWVRLGLDGQQVNGAPLPGRGNILAMAGNNTTLWAIGFGRPATTNPATKSAPVPSTHATTSITTAPAVPAIPPRPLLFVFTGNGWQDIAGLPLGLCPNDAHLVSMLVVDNAPVVALLDGNVIRTFRFDNSSHVWSETGNAAAGYVVRSLKLLPTPQRLVLWSCGEVGVGEFRYALLKGGWSAPQAIDEPRQAGAIVSRTAGVAGDELRIFIAVNGKSGLDFQEQKYRFDGTLSQKFTPIPWPADNATMALLAWWVNVGVGAALLTLMYLTIRRRRAQGTIAADPEKLNIAPLFLRTLAGVIDLLPMLAPWILYYYLHGDFSGSDVRNDPNIFWWEALSMALYIGPTLAMETIVGRSLGKLLVGLDIINLDGSRPTAWPLALRNLLRYVDVFFGFAPLLLVFISPLRQRLGDAAAGTVVVLRNPKPAEPNDQA